MKSVGIQLYTLRDEAEKDFKNVLQRLAGIGYKGVETAGLYGHDPREIAVYICDLGMQVTSSHSPLPTRENVSQLAEAELSIGNRYVITGFSSEQFKNLDTCKSSIEKLNTAVELLKPYGIRFGYHNHWHEFEKIDDRCIYDMILEEVPDLCSQLDIFWAFYAGIDTAQLVKKHSKRIPSLHIKDGLKNRRTPHLAVGDGEVPVFDIMNAADPDVLKWLIVELDEYDGSIWDPVAKSYNYLKKA